MRKTFNLGENIFGNVVVNVTHMEKQTYGHWYVWGTITNNITTLTLSMNNPRSVKKLIALLQEEYNNANSVSRGTLNDKYNCEPQKSFVGYHHSVTTFPNEDAKFYIGVENEILFFDGDERENFISNNECKYLRFERDSSLGLHGCETITNPLTPSDATNEETYYFLDDIKAWGFDTKTKDPSHHYGLHINVGMGAFVGDTHKGKTIALYHLICRKKWVGNIFCRPMRDMYYHEHAINAHEYILREYESEGFLGALDACRISGKLQDINIKTYALEFRRGRATTSKKRIVAIVEFILLLIDFCKSQRFKMDERTFIAFALENAKSETLKQNLLGA